MVSRGELMVRLAQKKIKDCGKYNEFAKAESSCNGNVMERETVHDFDSTTAQVSHVIKSGCHVATNNTDIRPIEEGIINDADLNCQEFCSSSVTVTHPTFCTESIQDDHDQNDSTTLKSFSQLSNVILQGMYTSNMDTEEEFFDDPNWNHEATGSNLGNDITLHEYSYNDNQAEDRYENISKSNMTNEEEELIDDPNHNSSLPFENVIDETLRNCTEVEDIAIGSEGQETNGIGQILPVKKKRRKIASPNQWKGIKNKNLREKGLPYLGYRRKKGDKQIHDTPRKERNIGETCNSKQCKKSKVRQCNLISEEKRLEVFKAFWNDLTWDAKKVYIASLVSYKEIGRKQTEGNSRRSGTYVYTLKIDNKVYTVCKSMFLNTFGLKEWTVLNWAKTSVHGIQQNQNNIDKEKDKSKDSPNVKAKVFLQSFLNSLPKLPSHYCRKSTSKFYLEPMWGNVSQLYDEYRSKCKENKELALSRFTFDRAMTLGNVSLYTPKKDQCDTCCSYKLKNISELEWQQHISRKLRAREEKDKDKKEAENGKCIVLTADLQALKVSPFINASAFYYKTKLVCHNYTIFDLVSHETKCYWFNETQANLEAPTFASCMIDYLSEKCCSSEMPIIIYSDGCCYQNRNAVLANALLSFSIHKNVTIYQKFLEKGHTQMEVDSVHATIESKLRNQPIYLPYEYVTYTQQARKKPFPYETKYLNFDFVKNFGVKGSLKYESIRPGRKRGDPKVTDIKVICYLPDGNVKVKTDFDGSWLDIAKRPQNIVVPHYLSFPQMFTEPLKISKVKYDHLQELKCVIPSDVHSFYDNLSHE